MKSRMRITATVGIATAVLLATSACSGGLLGGGETGGGGDGEESGPVNIGMVIPISGSSAPTGVYMENGAQLAVNEINDAGGILDGRMIELMVEDEACDAQQGVASANKLVSSNIAVSVGGYCSGATLPQLPIFAKANVPMIIPAANSQDLVNEKLKNVFLINGTGLQQSTAALDFIVKSGYESIALVDDNTSYSADITEETESQITEDGSATVALSTSVNAGESDYSAVVRDIIGSGADLTYWTGYYQEGGLIINQLRQAGYEGDIMVADGSADATLGEIAGGAAEGVFATMTPTPDTLEGAEDWIASYEKEFGSAPGPYSTQAYDAVRLAAEAIENAGSTDGDDIIAALEDINGFEMFSGALEFTPEHTLSSGGFVILKMEDGTFVLEDDLS